MKKRRRKKKPAAALEATYICDSCGEEIVVPVDISAGSQQDYFEGCPVCCHPMTLHVEIDQVQPGQWHVRNGFRADERLLSLGRSGPGVRSGFLETPLTPCCDGDFLTPSQAVSQSAAPGLRRLASSTDQRLWMSITGCSSIRP